MKVSDRYVAVMLGEPSNTRRAMLGKNTGYHIVKSKGKTYCGREISRNMPPIYFNDSLLTECRACCESLARELGVTPESLRLHFVMGDDKAEAIEADIDVIVENLAKKIKEGKR